MQFSFLLSNAKRAVNTELGVSDLMTEHEYPIFFMSFISYLFVFFLPSRTCVLPSIRIYSLRAFDLLGLVPMEA